MNRFQVIAPTNSAVNVPAARQNAIDGSNYDELIICVVGVVDVGENVTVWLLLENDAIVQAPGVNNTGPALFSTTGWTKSAIVVPGGGYYIITKTSTLDAVGVSVFGKPRSF